MSVVGRGQLGVFLLDRLVHCGLCVVVERLETTAGTDALRHRDLTPDTTPVGHLMKIQTDRDPHPLTIPAVGTALVPRLDIWHFIPPGRVMAGSLGRGSRGEL